jgi:hypothetical protein
VRCVLRRISIDHRALCLEADFYQLKELLDVLNPFQSDDKWTWTETIKWRADIVS